MAGGFATADAGAWKDYPGKMTPFVFLTCLLAATGGLSFGYNIGISGSLGSMYSFRHRFFPSPYDGKTEEAKEETHMTNSGYCKFECRQLTAFVSSLYVAALVASLLAATATRVFGRRWSMFAGGVGFLLGTIINGSAEHLAMLVVGRILLGIGIGFVNQSALLYLSEMAPARLRGMINAGFQLMVTIGILVANLVSYGNSKIWGWRVCLALAAVPAAVTTAGSLFLPDTPSSLLHRRRPAEARAVLCRIRGTPDVEEEYGDLAAAAEASRLVERPWADVFKRKHRPQLTMAIFVPIFQQLTGINVVMFYAPVLFKKIGLGDEAAVVSAVITGLANVFATFVCIFLVDRAGRRLLFLSGGAPMIVSLVVVGTLMNRDANGGVGTSHIKAGFMLVFLCVYVVGFAWSWGPLGWLVPSEMSPLEIRSHGQSLNLAVNMLFTFLIAEGFLSMLCHMRFVIFYYFAGWVAVMTAFVFLLLPETKGVPIEQVALVWRRHWFWGRFVRYEEVAAALVGKTGRSGDDTT